MYLGIFLTSYAMANLAIVCTVFIAFSNRKNAEITISWDSVFRGMLYTVPLAGLITLGVKLILDAAMS